MTARLYRPTKESLSNERNRCAIGLHEVTSGEFLVMEIDGSFICNSHFQQVMELGDSTLSRTDVESRIHKGWRQRSKLIAEREFVEELRRKSRSQQPGFIYYVQIGELVKIGYAGDVKRRMRGYPPHSRLLAVHPGTRETESEMHLKYRAFLRRGREWFDPHPVLMAHIDEVVAKFGKPSPLAHRMRHAAS